MLTIARRLISGERHRSDSSDTDGRAAFRVCKKLGESLAVLAGNHGFRSLLARALILAAAEVPWLAKLTVGANGSLIFPPELETQLSEKEAAAGGTALVTHLLELLSAFIGEALTLRLVQQVWPKAAFSDPQSRGKA